MSIVSLTFHAPENILQRWDYYVENTLILLCENLLDAEKYIVSEITSDYVNVGKNFSVLLVFADDEKRQQFLESELLNIEELVHKEFGDQVSIFKTLLNPRKTRF